MTVRVVMAVTIAMPVLAMPVLMVFAAWRAVALMRSVMCHPFRDP